MTKEEAVARIRNHKIAHKMNEPRAIYISEALDMAIEALEQEPKTGHWSREWYINRYEEICSVCGCGEDFKTDYCPNCGAKMVESQESENK